MTLNGAIAELAMLHEHSMMPNVFKPSIQKIIETISECEEPSVQPERKRGRWIPWDDGDYYECSACGALWTFTDGSPEENEANFCPVCGADMRGEQDE